MLIEGGPATRDFVKAGDRLFEEGDPGDAAFIVESGIVAIAKTVEGAEVELARLEAGELFGEMAIIDGSPRMARAIAIEDSVVVRIPADALAAKLAKFDPFLQALIKILVQNLRAVHEAYMRRARSADDSLTAIAHHADSLRFYVEKHPERTPGEVGTAALARLDESVAALVRLFADHEDRRTDVLTETDLARRGDG